MVKFVIEIITPLKPCYPQFGLLLASSCCFETSPEIAVNKGGKVMIQYTSWSVFNPQVISLYRVDIVSAICNVM